MSEHQTPAQRASIVCRRLADAPIVDPSDYLAPQAIIAAAIREAQQEAESQRSRALAVELALANRHLDDLQRAFAEHTGQTYEAYIFDPSNDSEEEDAIEHDHDWTIESDVSYQWRGIWYRSFIERCVCGMTRLDLWRDGECIYRIVGEEETKLPMTKTLCLHIEDATPGDGV